MNREWQLGFAIPAQHGDMSAASCAVTVDLIDL